MPKVSQFEELLCWQEARRLVKMVYVMTKVGPISRDFDLRNQIRRAALSTMSNIAEGFGRMSRKEFARFLEISSASASEVRSIAYAAIDLEYWTENEAAAVQRSAEKVRAMNRGLVKHLITQSSSH